MNKPSLNLDEFYMSTHRLGLKLAGLGSLCRLSNGNDGDVPVELDGLGVLLEDLSKEIENLAAQIGEYAVSR